MADHSLTDNFRALENTAPHAATQIQNDASHHLLADTFKMPEAKPVSSNLREFVGDAAATAAGAGVGAAAGVGMSYGLGFMSAVTMPFLTRKSISESADLGFQYGMKTITPRYALYGGLAALGAFELYKHTLGAPSEKTEKR